MKVDIRHTGHWDLENELAGGADGYQQFPCPLARIQSVKTGLSRLQNLLCCSRGNEKCLTTPCVDLCLLLAFILSTHPLQFSEAPLNRRMSGANFTMFTPSMEV